MWLIKVVYEDSIVDTIYDKNGEIKEIHKQEGRPKPDLLIMNETTSIFYDSNDSTSRALKDMGLSLLTNKMLDDFCSRNKSSIKPGPFYGFDGSLTYASIAKWEKNNV
jgi:hypothetical protein